MFSNRPKRLELLRNYVDEVSNRSEPKSNEKDVSAPLEQQISSSINSSPAPSLDPSLLEQFPEIIDSPLLDDTDGEIAMLVQESVTNNGIYHNIESEIIIDNGNDEDASALLVQQKTNISNRSPTPPLESLGPCLQEEISLKDNTTFADEVLQLPSLDADFDLMEDSDDTVKDKHYEPDTSDSSSEDEPSNSSSEGKSSLAISKLQKRKTENDSKSENKKRKQNYTQFNRDSVGNDISNRIKNSKRGQKGETRLIRNERKKMRNFGNQYLTKKKKVVPERKCRDLQTCRLKCSERIEDEIRKTIFMEYWSMGSFNRRVAYIAALVFTKEKETTRAKKPDKNHKNRNLSHTYHLRINGQMTKVCKKCFLSTFDESNKFLTNVIKKKESSLSGITLEDRRGRGVPYNKTSEVALDLIKTHISSLPSYESHYRRKQTENKFLPSYYTLSRIYEEYKKWIPETMTPVSRRIYEQMFHSMKIKIKNPKKDSCAKCDKIDMQLKNTSDTASKQTLENDLTKHQTDAEYAYESKRMDIQEALHDRTKSVYTFDLQQCLPTPDIQTSVVFYKRQLWTFNLTVHRCEDKQVFCYMWDESTAGRGANQIASCLYRQLIESLDPEIKTLTLYSDTCAGQNKNSFLPVMYMLLMRKVKSLEHIDHKFLEPGHTHMECDTDHSIIEKQKKKHEAPIEHPRDWMQLVRMCGKTKPFKVIQMERKDFFEFSALLKSYFINKKINQAGEQVVWRDIKWLRYSSQFGIVQYKNTLKHEEPFKTIDFRRKSKISLSNNIMPPLSYKGPVPINSKKKENLIELLPYIDKNFHLFYENLTTKDDIPNTLSSSDEESE